MQIYSDQNVKRRGSYVSFKKEEKTKAKPKTKKEEVIMPFSKYSPKQKKLARVAKPRNKITGADFKKLKAKKKTKKK